MPDLSLTTPKANPVTAAVKESGKVGLALLLWLLGVPGILVLLYLILS